MARLGRSQPFRPIFKTIPRASTTATVGYATIGANTQNAGSASGTGNPTGLLVTMPTTGSITKITAYVAMTSTSKNLFARIYSGSAGSRGSLLATSNSTLVTSTFGWVDFTFATPYAASATTYWLEYSGYGGDGPGTSFAQIKYDTGGATNTGYDLSDIGVPQYETNRYSMYATYTTSGGGTTYNQTYTEAITVSGVLVRSTIKLLTDAITSTDTFTRAGTLARTIAEVVTNTDSLLKSTGRSLIEAVTNTATFLGTVAHTSTLTEAVTSTATLLRTLTRTLLETVTSSDTFARISTLARTLTETVTSVDTLIKTVGRTLVEAITNSDVFAYVNTPGSSLSTSLVSYWKFDEASGNAADSTANALTLTNNGTVTYGAAKLNNGATTGSSKYFEHADNALYHFSTAFTYSTWINFSSTSGTNAIFGKWDDSGQFAYLFRLESGNTLTAYLASTGTTTTSGSVSWTPSTATWYHLVCVYDGSAGSVSFYVNGSQQGATQTSQSTSLFSNTTPFTISARRASGVVSEYVSATIDETALWGRVLTSTEIGRLYNSGSPLPYPFGSSYTKTLTDAVTYADTLLRSIGRTFTELITDTATVIRTTTRSLIETVTSSDILLKLPTRSLLEIITNTDTLLAKITARVLSEAATISDSLIRTTGRTLSDAVTSLDTLVKTTGRTLLETITHTDVFSSIKSRGATFTEAITYADTLIHSLTRIFAEAVTSTASFLGFNGNLRTFTEVIASTDTLLRTVGRNLLETTVIADILTAAKSLARTFAETVTNTASILRVTGRTLTQSVTASDTFARALTIVRAFTETITLSATVQTLRNGLSTFWTNATRTTAALANRARTNATLINTAKSISSWINKDKS
jgi:hypothetical protein